MSTPTRRGGRPVADRVGRTLAALALLCGGGCQNQDFWGRRAASEESQTSATTPLLRVHRPESLDTGLDEGLERLTLRGVRNEWLDVVLSRPGGRPSGTAELVWRLRPMPVAYIERAEGGKPPGPAEVLQPPDIARFAAEASRVQPGDVETRPSVAVDAWRVQAYRVVSVEADTRDVRWVRWAGPGSANGRLPRALVPLERRAQTAGEEEARFVVPAATEAIYIEWCVPLDAPAGRYTGELVWEASRESASLPLELQVDDLALSGSSDFAVVGEVGWAALAAAWPDVFATIEPRWLSRLEAAHVPAVERLDQLVRLARINRLDVAFTDLAPTVKSTPREGLRLDWSEYDTVVLPWLRGEAGAETPTGRDGLGGITVLPRSRWLQSGSARPADDVASYWQSVVSHFDQQRLLSRTVVPAGVDVAQLGEVGAQRVRRRIELAPWEVSWSKWRRAAWRAALAGTRPAWDTPTADAESAPLVPIRTGPAWAVVAGEVLASGVRAADERAWGAKADRSVGRAAAALGPPTAAWFYPASVVADVPRGMAVVPGVAIKWARRAQQDWELLDLAYRRGGAVGSSVAGGFGGRFVVLSVLQALTGELDPNATAASNLRPSGAQPSLVRGSGWPAAPDADASTGSDGEELLSAAADAALWEAGMELVRRAAAWRDPSPIRGGPEADAWQLAQAAEVQRWLMHAEAPRFTVRHARWSQAVPGGDVRLELGLTGVGSGVERRTAGLSDATVEGDVVRLTLRGEELGSARAWPTTVEVEATASPPGSARFVRELAVPVAVVRTGADDLPTRLDGGLDDWTTADVVHSGGLVRMLDLPSAQSGRLVRSGKDTQILMRWTPEALSIGLRLSGVSQVSASTATNFAPETAGRGSGEDLCRLILRSSGVELRLLLKPTGLTVEHASAAAGVAYATRVDPDRERGERLWRAELRIPAQLLGGRLSPGQALEMNLIRHDEATGESSSWAGPVDRDLQPVYGLVLLGPR